MDSPAQPLDDAPRRQLASDARRKFFISYASQDRDFALWLAHELRAGGATVWIDQAEIQGGEAWLQKLEEGLEASTELLLIVSPQSKASPFVWKELSGAFERKMTVTPVLHRRCGPWAMIADLQYIDFTKWDEEGLAKLLGRKPPHRTVWRRCLIFLNTVRAYRSFFSILAAAIGIATLVYFLSPSSTSLEIAGGDPSALVVRVRNRGGRPSLLAGGSFKLHFGSLPIDAEPLVLLQPEKVSRVSGHADVLIRLTHDQFLTPKKKNDESYFAEDDLEPLLADAKITLRGQVMESDGRFHPRSGEISAERIKNFVLEAFPDDVP